MTFVDPLEEGWFTESNGSMIGEDDMHPNDDGVRVLADRFEEIIAAEFERRAA